MSISPDKIGYMLIKLMVKNNLFLRIMVRWFTTTSGIYLLCMLGAFSGYAQKRGKAEILSVKLDEIQEKIRIDYSLKASGKARFLVQLFYSKDGGQTFEGPMKSVLGDAGENISMGKEKKIYWDFLIDDPNFNGKGISFKIKAFLMNPTIYARPVGGPANALLSLVAPGLGDMKVRRGGGWYGLITAAAFTTLGTGLYLRLRAQTNYDKYKTATSPEGASDLLGTAQSQNNLSVTLINTAIVIWVADVALVAFQGFRNQRLRRQKLSLGLQPVRGKPIPTLGFSLRF